MLNNLAIATKLLVSRIFQLRLGFCVAYLNNASHIPFLTGIKSSRSESIRIPEQLFETLIRTNQFRNLKYQPFCNIRSCSLLNILPPLSMVIFCVDAQFSDNVSGEKTKLILFEERLIIMCSHHPVFMILYFIHELTRYSAPMPRPRIKDTWRAERATSVSQQDQWIMTASIHWYEREINAWYFKKWRECIRWNWQADV